MKMFNASLIEKSTNYIIDNKTRIEQSEDIFKDKYLKKKSFDLSFDRQLW